MVLSGFAKTTVIKQPEDFAEHEGVPDVTIFSCHDSYIYLLGPIRYPLLTMKPKCMSCILTVLCQWAP